MANPKNIKNSNPNELAIQILKDKILGLNESIMHWTNFLRRKKPQRFGMTKCLARKRKKIFQKNRELLKSSIQKLNQ